MADETTRVDQWLTTVLTADSALAAIVAARVYSGIAPRSASWPAVVFQFQGGVDVRGNGPNRIMLSGLWLVRGIWSEPSYGGALQDIADRIDAVLHGKPAAGSMIVASVDGASILSSVREQPFRLEDETDGVQYRHLGGIYRIQAQI